MTISEGLQAAIDSARVRTTDGREGIVTGHFPWEARLRVLWDNGETKPICPSDLTRLAKA